MPRWLVIAIAVIVLIGMAVFVFGMVLWNKESFGFRMSEEMSEEETERLDEPQVKNRQYVKYAKKPY